MKKQWHIWHTRTSECLSPDAIVEALLTKRGYCTEEERHLFLNPRLQNLADPFRLPDMLKAVIRVEQALAKKESILIYSDYDVDGMTSAAVLYRFLTSLGGKVRVFVPDRQTEGYGLSFSGMERALAEGTKPELFMVLDCGTTSAKEISHLKSQEIDSIIIDHHTIPAIPAEPLAFINPQNTDEDQTLATVGLVFKFCHAFLKNRQTPNVFDLKKHLDLVALGTVADLVPLQGDNRILVRQGLNEMKQTAHIGLQELMRRAGVKRTPTPGTCGFMLGPRLNASGRLANARAGFELLVTHDRSFARKLTDQLETLNRERQAIEQAVLEEAEIQAIEYMKEHDRVIVVASRAWHQGVIGIVASRLLKRYHRPSIIISINENGKGKGSSRSIEGCSMIDLLNACKSSLLLYGGHAMAAGIEIEEGKIDSFRVTCNEWLNQHISAEAFKPSLKIDFFLRGNELTEELVSSMIQLEPFGQQNQAPVFMVSQVRTITSRPFGNKHLKLTLEANGNRFDAIAFNMADTYPKTSFFNIAGHWEWDEFTDTPNFRILDWQS